MQSEIVPWFTGDVEIMNSIWYEIDKKYPTRKDDMSFLYSDAQVILWWV